MDKKQLINDIEIALTHDDYDAAIHKIDELNIDADNLKSKVKRLEITYSKIATVGGLLQDGFVTPVEHEVIRKRILSTLLRDRVDFFRYLANFTK